MTISLTKIRERLSRAHGCTTFYPQTNQTYYPARWTFGDGAGSAATACYYDRRRQLAAERVAIQLGLDMVGRFDDELRLRDCADLIASALREQASRDAAVDAACL